MTEPNNELGAFLIEDKIGDVDKWVGLAHDYVQKLKKFHGIEDSQTVIFECRVLRDWK